MRRSLSRAVLSCRRALVCASKFFRVIQLAKPCASFGSCRLESAPVRPGGGGRFTRGQEPILKRIARREGEVLFHTY